MTLCAQRWTMLFLFCAFAMGMVALAHSGQAATDQQRNSYFASKGLLAP